MSGHEVVADPAEAAAVLQPITNNKASDIKQTVQDEGFSVEDLKHTPATTVSADENGALVINGAEHPKTNGADASTNGVHDAEDLSLTSPEPIIPAKEGTLDSTVESEAPPSNPSEDAEHGSVDATVGSSEASVPTKESEQTEVPTESVASLDAPAHVDVESVEEPAAARVEELSSADEAPVESAPADSITDSSSPDKSVTYEDTNPEIVSIAKSTELQTEAPASPFIEPSTLKEDAPPAVGIATTHESVSSEPAEPAAAELVSETPTREPEVEHSEPSSDPLATGEEQVSEQPSEQAELSSSSDVSEDLPPAVAAEESAAPQVDSAVEVLEEPVADAPTEPISESQPTTAEISSAPVADETALESPATQNEPAVAPAVESLAEVETEASITAEEEEEDKVADPAIEVALASPSEPAASIIEDVQDTPAAAQDDTTQEPVPDATAPEVITIPTIPSEEPSHNSSVPAAGEDKAADEPLPQVTPEVAAESDPAPVEDAAVIAEEEILDEPSIDVAADVPVALGSATVDYINAEDQTLDEPAASESVYVKEVEDAPVASVEQTVAEEAVVEEVPAPEVAQVDEVVALEKEECADEPLAEAIPGESEATFVADVPVVSAEETVDEAAADDTGDQEIEDAPLASNEVPTSEEPVVEAVPEPETAESAVLEKNEPVDEPAASQSIPDDEAEDAPVASDDKSVSEEPVVETAPVPNTTQVEEPIADEPLAQATPAETEAAPGDDTHIVSTEETFDEPAVDATSDVPVALGSATVDYINAEDQKIDDPAAAMDSVPVEQVEDVSVIVVEPAVAEAIAVEAAPVPEIAAVQEPPSVEKEEGVAEEDSDEAAAAPETVFEVEQIAQTLDPQVESGIFAEQATTSADEIVAPVQESNAPAAVISPESQAIAAEPAAELTTGDHAEEKYGSTVEDVSASLVTDSVEHSPDPAEVTTEEQIPQELHVAEPGTTVEDIAAAGISEAVEDAAEPDAVEDQVSDIVEPEAAVEDVTASLVSASIESAAEPEAFGNDIAEPEASATDTLKADVEDSTERTEQTLPQDEATPVVLPTSAADGSTLVADLSTADKIVEDANEHPEADPVPDNESFAELHNLSQSTPLQTPSDQSDDAEEGNPAVVETEVQEQPSEAVSLSSPTPELERPRSPWTPSYSVDTQGPGVVFEDVNTFSSTDAEAQDEEHNPPISISVPTIVHPKEEIAEPTEITVDTTASNPSLDSPRPQSPWTPSYSVSVQGSPLCGSTELEEDATPEHADQAGSETLPELGSVLAFTTQEAEANTTPSIPESSALDSADSISEVVVPTLVLPDDPVTSTEPEPPVDASDEPPRPKSPWTPSYSVSAQGSPLISSTDLAQDGVPDEVSMGSVPDSDIPILQQAPDGPEEFADVNKVEVPAIVDPTTEGADTVAPAQPEITLDTIVLDTSIDPPRPSSPWTPSYSVSVQGSPLPGTTELPQEDLPSAQDNFASELEAEKETTEIPSVQEPQKDDAISEETPANVAPPVEVATVVQVPTEKTSDVASQTTVDTTTLEAPSDQPRPASPWTPSYSVSVQGSPLPSSAELAPEEPTEDQYSTGAAAVDADEPIAVPDSSDLLVPAQAFSEPTTVSSDVGVPSIVHSLADAPAATLASEVTEDNASLDPFADPPRPSSPWTPSYSVSVQGSPVTESVVNNIPEAEVHAEAEPESDAHILETRLIESEEPASPAVPDLSSAVSEISIPTLIHPDEEEIAVAPTETHVDASPAEVDNSARPTSPWTPSYSVSVQGSPLVESVELPDETDPTTGPKTGEADESLSQPEIYDIVSAPSTAEDYQPGPAQEAPAHNILLATSVPHINGVETATPSSFGQADLPATVEEETPAEKVEENKASLSLAEPEIERPKSPWTASYSTSQQGPASPLNEKEPEVLPPTTSAETGRSEPASAVDGIETPSASESLNLVIPSSDTTVEPPKSPWTPSYSVSRQGSGVFDSVDDAEELDKLEQLPASVSQDQSLPSSDGVTPSIEVAEPTDLKPFPKQEEDKKSLRSKLSLSPLNEDTVTNTMSSSLELPSPTTRTRLESTASSLFFPGGWFAKVPQGRASLDNAQGEFSPPKPTSPTEETHASELSIDSVSDANDLSKLTTSIEETATTAPESQTDDASAASESGEKKGKWCVVM